MNLPQKNKSNLFEFFSDAEAALDYLNKKHPEAYLGRKWLETLDADLPDDHLLKINFKDIVKELMDAKRFREVSVVVVDYDMPGMDGIEFCKGLKNPYIQKILATGAADESLAVSAFNAKHIDAFVAKHEMDFLGSLGSKIHKLQSLYFQKVTYPVYLSLKLKTKAALLLDDPVFVAFFNDLLVQHKIEEYYQLEASGTFLLFDQAGQHHVLFVYNEDKIDADKLEIANDVESELHPKLREAIMTEKKMLCYYDLLSYTLPLLSEWHKYALDVSKLKGRFGSYYYALASNYLKLDATYLRTFQSLRSEGMLSFVNHAKKS